jgi:homoaconitase/3-isopropylmalate dehydratase large subunit
MTFGKTLVEKVISRSAAGKVSAGDVAMCPVDAVMIHDGTGMLTIQEFLRLKREGFPLARPDRTLVVLDHTGPCSRIELANDHIQMRQFARENGAVLYDLGSGVCHQLLVEKWARPGTVVLGADSHTCTSGALGALGTGMGSTDVAVAMATGCNWFRVPGTFQVELSGSLPEGVHAKDIILHLKVAARTRLLVMPCFPDVYRAALEAGYIRDLFDAGAVILPTGCGPCSAVYSLTNDINKLWIMLFFGVAGYILHKMDFPLPPMLLGVVLGDMMEAALRQSLALSKGSWLIFIQRPVATVLLIVFFVVAIWQLFTIFKHGRTAWESDDA